VPDWYFAGGFLFHRASGRVLLHLRGASAQVNPSAWAFFGGSSEEEDGRDPIATWCREMREELGVEVDRRRVVPLCDYLNRLGNHRYVYYCEWPSLAEDFVLGEGEAFAWFGVEEALALPNLTHGTRLDLGLFRDRMADERVGRPA
jgi:8-oxo-dGTP pyrophosphatase MutT (NUDIX family)